MGGGLTDATGLFFVDVLRQGVSNFQRGTLTERPGQKYRKIAYIDLPLLLKVGLQAR